MEVLLPKMKQFRWKSSLLAKQGKKENEIPIPLLGGNILLFKKILCTRFSALLGVER